MYQYKTEQFLPLPIKEAWAFFSSPGNLSRITPPEMDFKILTKLNGEAIFEGMKIDYTVKPLFGIPLHWQTEICTIQYPETFTDKQTKGPYKTWEHTHTFTQAKGGVLMNDVVNYKIPFGIAGDLLHSMVIRKKIETIFDFRKKALNKLFTVNGNNSN